MVDLFFKVLAFTGIVVCAGICGVMVMLVAGGIVGYKKYLKESKGDKK